MTRTHDPAGTTRASPPPPTHQALPRLLRGPETRPPRGATLWGPPPAPGSRKPSGTPNGRPAASHAVLVPLCVAMLLAALPASAQTAPDAGASAFVDVRAWDPGIQVPRHRIAVGIPRFAGAAFAAGAGSLAGGYAGWLVPRLFDADACQETCAGMWVTVPAGSVLGAALGAKLTGAEWRRALIGSTVGLGAAVGVGVALQEWEGAGFTAFVTHALVTAWWAHR